MKENSTAFQESGRDGSGFEDVGGEGKPFPEPLGKMAKPEAPQSWSSGHSERMPSLSANRGGKQGGWSKPSSK